MSKQLSEALDEAMRAVSKLSNCALSSDKHEIRFAANRAWHELFNARHNEARPAADREG